MSTIAEHELAQVKEIEYLKDQLITNREIIRDQLAMAAITGILANPVRWQQIKDQYEAGKITYEETSRKNATKAYSVADAMLLARKGAPRGD